MAHYFTGSHSVKIFTHTASHTPTKQSSAVGSSCRYEDRLSTVYIFFSRSHVKKSVCIQTLPREDHEQVYFQFFVRIFPESVSKSDILPKQTYRKRKLCTGPPPPSLQRNHILTPVNKKNSHILERFTLVFSVSVSAYMRPRAIETLCK